MKQLRAFRHCKSVINSFWLIVTYLTMSNYSMGQILEHFIDGMVVSEIKINGSSVISQNRIDDIKSEFEGRLLYTEDVIALRDKITQLYIDADFVTSGAIIPLQEERDVVNGVLNLQVIEGNLPELHFDNTGRVSERYLTSKVHEHLKYPLNAADLSTLISQLENDVRLESIQGRLLPASERGESQLYLTIAEADVFAMSVNFNNYLSPSVGSEQLGFTLSHLNLFGQGDEFYVNLNKSQGVDGVSIAYNYPLLSTATVLQSYFSKGDTLVIEEPFDSIDVKSDTDTVGLSLTKHFILSSDQTLAIVGGIEKKTSQTSILGEPFDFSPGSVDGESRASIAFTGIEYRQQTSTRALVLKSTWRRGISLWNATRTSGDSDGRFDSLITQAQFASRVAPDVVLSVRANSQLTRDSIQAFERLALGGHQSIKGYRENQLLKDNGWEVLVEADIRVTTGFEWSGITTTLVPSVSYGRAWDSERTANVDRGDYLSSVGLGFHIAAANGLSFNLDWAYRLNNRNRQSNELQDNGIHLGLNYVF